MATKKSTKTASKAVKKHMHEFKHGEKMRVGRKIKNPKHPAMKRGEEWNAETKNPPQGRGDFEGW